MKKLLLYFSLIGLLMACEEEIDVDLDAAESQLVVEAEIEANAYVWAKLSRTSDFFNNAEPPAVNNAVVSLIENESGQREILQNQGNGTYLGNSILGQERMTYTLEIDLEGQLYSAQSKLNPPVVIEEINFNEFSGGGPFGGNDDENQYIILTDFRSSGDDVYYQLEYDLSENTETEGYFLVEPADSNRIVRFGNPGSLANEGESFTVRVNSIDRGVYTYFTGLAELSGGGFGGGGGGSATPSNPISNFEPRILGYFAALSSATKDTVAP